MDFCRRLLLNTWVFGNVWQTKIRNFSRAYQVQITDWSVFHLLLRALDFTWTTTRTELSLWNPIRRADVIKILNLARIPPTFATSKGPAWRTPSNIVGVTVPWELSLRQDTTSGFISVFDCNATLQLDQAGMKRVILEFYAELYRNPGLPEYRILSADVGCLKFMQPEVGLEIRRLTSRTSPGMDRVIRKFLKALMSGALQAYCGKEHH